MFLPKNLEDEPDRLKFNISMADIMSFFDKNTYNQKTKKNLKKLIANEANFSKEQKIENLVECNLYSLSVSFALNAIY